MVQLLRAWFMHELQAEGGLVTICCAHIVLIAFMP